LFAQGRSIIFITGRWAIPPPKNHAQQKPTKKNRPKGAIGKNRASAFYFSGPGLNRKKILAQAIAHQKSHAQPRGAKKFSCPKKFPNP